ncbi:MAG: PEP-CTERM sorting domain-containing protein [Verrucomicrobia bacterium]|nr:PEP-CTERM sorting domain-containing protein [Verrucomicrobiota bacterium]MCH8513155.1 PEP-CTERM sorting domain-containing protein [Kiritimatiellia bacterium]
MKKFFLLMMFIPTSFIYAAFTLSWNNASGNNLLDSVGDPLIGAQSDGNVGYFAQLIYAGPSGIISPLDLNSADGAGGENVVIGYSHVGRNMGFDPVNGNINATTSGINLPQGSLIFARFFDAVSPDYSSGLVPTPYNGGFGMYYGDTSTFYTVSAANADPVTPVNSTWQFGGVMTATVIPEPGTVMLMLVGFASAVITVKRRRNRIN